MIIILSLIFIAALSYLAFRRGLIFMQIAQQDEYTPERLYKWYLDNKAFDTRASFILGVGLLLGFSFGYWGIVLLFAAVFIYLIAVMGDDPRYKAKLKLNFTQRAKKTFGLYLAIYNLVLILIFLFTCCSTYKLLSISIILVQLIPFVLILTLKILTPFEMRLQERYFNDAKAIVAKENPFIVGVTGSYGKTSVKNALADILQVTLGSTFWPGAGTNSKMGIVRDIRERLNSSYRYAVIEMAAYHVGSIATLCELSPPKIGIITAIGKQHLERFGSQDAIYQAKTELARALPADGVLIVNADNELANKAGHEFKVGKNLFYGLNDQPHVNFLAKNISYSFEGSSFEIHHEGNVYNVKTKLIGSAAISNLVGVFAATQVMGCNPKLVTAAFGNLKPVNNRLALERVEAQKVTYLHDGYNSNEKGFVSALEVLGKLDAKRRIIMTPGVIELADQQFEINKILAEEAAKVCDYVVIVSDENKESFKAGIKGDKLITVATREEAFLKVAELSIPETIILIENDLSDYHEAKYKF